MDDQKEVYRNLPGVDTLLASPELFPFLTRYGKELLTAAIRISLEEYRQQIGLQPAPPLPGEILNRIKTTSVQLGGRHLKRMYNATGILIHTNLGRAPFSREMLCESFQVLEGYSNLEFDLDTGNRGNRNDHASALLKFLTGAGDVLVVNNAAAAVMLILRTFAKNREVIVSRGELIEIGGSFRLPEIMAASDCKMVEVGTTNKTRISDYAKAVTGNTGLLFKAHKSNYSIRGFSEEVTPAALARLGRELGIPVVYDMGSGLLKKIAHPAFDKEPSVREALATGVDLVCFSGDKLLGGPQAGIIAGKKQLVEKLKNEPMLRALRVCKTTLALLETTCSYFLNEEDLNTKNWIFKTFHKTREALHAAAEELKSQLSQQAIDAVVTPSSGQCGGGSLPDTRLDSFAVMIRFGRSNREKSAYAGSMYRQLLAHEKPVLAILKQGTILFDLLTVDPGDIPALACLIAEAHRMVLQKMTKLPDSKES